MTPLPLLLTASVDTRGMQGSCFQAMEREKMYVDTLNFYIDHLGSKKERFEMVFVENSGWNKNSVLGKLHHSDNIYIEYIALEPELFDQSKGKGYNELLMMENAILASSTIQSAGAFFKLTGRFPILNLYSLLKEVDRRGGQKMKLYADCKDHNVYDWLHLPINGHAGECRYYAVSLDFWNRNIKGRYKELNDYTGPLVEDLFLEVIRNNKNLEGVHGRFRTQAQFSGGGGHSLGNGPAFFYSTDNDSVTMKIKRGIRQGFRWLAPWWWC